MFCPIRTSVKGGAFERAETEHQMGCNDICWPIAPSSVSPKTSSPMTSQLSDPSSGHIFARSNAPYLRTPGYPSRPIPPSHFIIIYIYRFKYFELLFGNLKQLSETIREYPKPSKTIHDHRRPLQTNQNQSRDQTRTDMTWTD